jgi:D-psicose/D-tagatose/L-ribulose 3-epimerase
MKLAVSNIAWPIEWNAAALERLHANGIGALEVAPTMVWPNWVGIDAGSVRDFRRRVEAFGLTISSLQSILFQRPELQLFGSEQRRSELDEHLRRCADLAVDLGAYALVFGAPKNRVLGERTEDEAFAMAAEFFAKIGDYCAGRGVCLVFEANPAEYGCNFATDSGTAARLVRAAGSAGFQLHLDTACMHLAGEDATESITRNAGILRHFHVSEAYLGSFANPSLPHAGVAGALRESGYDGWVTLEMRASEPPLPALEESIRSLRRLYDDGN